MWALTFEPINQVLFTTVIEFKKVGIVEQE